MWHCLLRRFCVVITFVFVLCLCGCSAGEIGEEVPAPSETVTVYDDGVYIVEIIDSGRSEESGDVQLCLRFTNRSTDSIAFSSVLGMRVNSSGTERSVKSLPDSRVPLDGLLDAGESREGWVSFEAPAEQGTFTMEMAVDFLNDLWITFDVSL